MIHDPTTHIHALLRPFGVFRLRTVDILIGSVCVVFSFPMIFVVLWMLCGFWFYLLECIICFKLLIDEDDDM